MKSWKIVVGVIVACIAAAIFVIYSIQVDYRGCCPGDYSVIVTWLPQPPTLFCPATKYTKCDPPQPYPWYTSIVNAF